MTYDHSLTFAVQARIDSYVEQQTAQANTQLSRKQTAEELLRFLRSSSSLNTPGFVLRRHIQAQGLVSKEECADLSQCGNVPWPEEVCYRAALELSHISYTRHKPISTENWERYLTDAISQGIQRKMVFQLAVVTGMGQGDTIDLLLSCAQAPYRVRDSLELICYFCQRVPGQYTWQDIMRLKKAWDRSASASDQKESMVQGPTSGNTQVLRHELDEIFTASLPAREAERRLLSMMAEHQAEFTGISLTARTSYLRLTEYLQALYTPGSQSNLHGLISAMYQAQDWKFDDLFQSPKGQRRYVFRGGLQDESASLEILHGFDTAMGSVAMFCKRYYSRANAIQQGAKWVDRRDILLLGYFLITGYMEANRERRAEFAGLICAGSSLDDRMGAIRNALELLRQGMTDLRERWILCSQVLNELLAEFSLPSLYVPGIFDRFILLCLLTEHPDWTARYLLGEDV